MVKDHLGNEYKSQGIMCKKYNIGKETFRFRIRNGWSKEDALTTPPNSTRADNFCKTDHEGRTFNSKREMLKFYNVSEGTFDGRRKKGWNIHDCLFGRKTISTRKDCPVESRTDHEGRVFNTVKEMLTYWNVSEGTFTSRRWNGWNMKESLLGREEYTPRIDIEKRTDPYGKVFPSAKAMCDYHGRSYRAYACALTRGWSKEEALFGKKKVSRVPEEKRTDHLGNVYDSVTLMCQAYNLSLDTYMSRIEDGWSKEKALTTKPHITDTTCEDHLGNTYSSETEMCRHYNIFEGTYRARIHQGWSKEKALTKPVAKMKIACVDHLGNEYPSKTAMCKAWGHKNTKIFDSRINELNWTLKEALTGNHDVTNSPRCIKDHLGNKFPTKKAMCDHWGISVNSYDNRIMNGWSMRKALTTKTKFRSYEYKGWKFLEPVYESPEGVTYYLCKKSENEEVLSKEEIELECH